MSNTSLTAYYAAQAAAMTEATLQSLIVRSAQQMGWRVYHTRDSRGSNPGWPDLVLARGRRLLFRELKTQKGRLRPEQSAWLFDLEQAGQDAAIWRPADWFSDAILNDLQEERR